MRVYLDHNATTALRPEAKEAMRAAMEICGNPSSDHAEGRQAKGLMERARSDIAEAAGASGAEVIFTASATEACALALNGADAVAADIEHDAVMAWCAAELTVDEAGQVVIEEGAQPYMARQKANSETGLLQQDENAVWFCDAVQAFGKIPYSFAWENARCAALSAHKIGGPKGVGALIVEKGTEIPAALPGGGQEMGRRSGTENIVGIAGFAAAAKAAARDLADGVWERIEALRDAMEEKLLNEAKQLHIVGKEAARLPNTSCLMLPGWRGETQVMQMDLAGLAISAGSACSSGKVRESRVLRVMGYDALGARSAIRVSLGIDTMPQDVDFFVKKWVEHYRRYQQKAA